MRTPQQVESSPEEKLGKLGYPGFAHLVAEYLKSPQNAYELLRDTLSQPDYPARVAEGLPWVVCEFAEALDWKRLTDELTKSHFQNRLGFVVSLGRELALRKQNQNAATVLSRAEKELEKLRTEEEHSLSSESRLHWDRKRRRSPEATRWNLWTTLDASQLEHCS